MKTTYIAMLIDESSSMSSLRSATIDAVNSMLATSEKRSTEENQKTIITIIPFADRPKVAVMPSEVSFIKKITTAQYSPNGMTAMFDAVGLAVKTIKPLMKSKEDAALIICITDGDENASMDYNARSIKKLIQEHEETDQWTFTFQVPRGNAAGMCRTFGLSPDNVREWETNLRGLNEATQSNNTGLSSYFTARSSGQTSTKKFYESVTTDLSKVSKAKVKRDLQDLSSEFALIEVKAEAVIKELVEAKTKKPYEIGKAFYLLMKREEIQPTKEVLLMEKGKSAVFGGDAARDLIGLPDGAHAKVSPGNHSNYDIFVQSTSVNRKLPRGTKLLIRR